MAQVTSYGYPDRPRLGPHALDDADDGYALPSYDDAYDPASGSAMADAGNAGEVAALQYDASPTRDVALYAASRASRFAMLRWPLAVTLVVAVLIAATWTAWSPVMTGVSEGASTLAARKGDGQTRVSVTVALVAFALLAFAAAWWRGSHPRRPVRLSDGRGTIAVDAIAGQLRAAILDLPEVRAAEVAVENRGGGQIRVRSWLRVTAEARIDDVLDAVDDVADWLVHHHLGLLLSEPPLAEVRYDELNLRAARAPDGSRAAGSPDGETHD